MKPHIIGAIFARGGSKGLPGKNIKPLCGKPLLSYSIHIGKEIESIHTLYVSTDDEAIAQVAKGYGAEVPFLRPKELAQDQSSEWLAWQHLLHHLNQKKKIDILVSLPATSPLRSKDDVQKSLDTLLNTDADIVVGIQETNRNPYFNMVTCDENQNIKLAATSSQNIVRRQDAPKMYDMTTVVYAAKADYVLQADSLFSGKVKGILIPAERAIDIDTQLDFDIAEFLMSRQLKQQSRS